MNVRWSLVPAYLAGVSSLGALIWDGTISSSPKHDSYYLPNYMWHHDGFKTLALYFHLPTTSLTTSAHMPRKKEQSKAQNLGNFALKRKGDKVQQSDEVQPRKCSRNASPNNSSIDSGASKVPAYVERYAPLEQIPVHEVHNITMKLLANPGVVCIPCILANKFCEFRGWNQPCTACLAAHATGCTFRATESELQLTLNEIDPWISLGAKRTWYLVVDMHMAFVRAMHAQREAVINSIKFRQKFVDFAYHIGDITSICGSSALEARFKSDTDSTVELRAAVNKLVADLNDIDTNLLQRHNEAHIANFNPDRAAHGGMETLERPATPPPSHPMAQPGSRGPPGDADGDVAMTQTDA
ncbi:hypothetical protein K438DRAFT_1774052 [Mycena galopus ATCC 62051]|nr:hypothetical protein K438DRAFT_1774052 [Mycena galopus ATCC 62051]